MFGCLGCDMKFTGLTAFEAHRTGNLAESTGDDRRRCRTPDEMQEIGYIEKNGKWVKPMTDAQKERLYGGK